MVKMKYTQNKTERNKVRVTVKSENTSENNWLAVTPMSAELHSKAGKQGPAGLISTFTINK